MRTKRTPQGFLSKKAAAEYLSVSERTLDILVSKGELPAYRVTRKLTFRTADLDALAERRRIRSGHEIAAEVLEEAEQQAEERRVTQ